MLNLLREGGVPIWFVLIFGGLTLLAAALFAARGDRRRVGFIVWMGGATLLSIGAATAADLAAVGHHFPDACRRADLDAPACVLTGFAESMAPGILGFSLLALAAMLAAVGSSRSARANP